MFQADFLDDLAGLVAKFLPPPPIAHQRMPNHQRGDDVFFEAQFRQQMIELKDEPEHAVPQLVARLGGQIIDPPAVQKNLAHVRRVQESQQMQQRAFAGTGLPHDRQKLPALGGDFHALQHADFFLPVAVSIFRSRPLPDAKAARRSPAVPVDSPSMCHRSDPWPRPAPHHPQFQAVP